SLRIDPPEVVPGAVDERHRDLLAVVTLEVGVAGDVAFGPGDVEFGADLVDDRARFVTQVAPGPGQHQHPRRVRHTASSWTIPVAHPTQPPFCNLGPLRLRRRSAGLDHTSRARAVAASPAEAAGRSDSHPDSRVAAFFDLDNTVLRGASLFYLARGMYARGLLRTGDIARFGYRQLRFALGAEDHEHIDQARAAALSLIAGRSVAELFEVAEESFDEWMADKIWPGTQAIARMHVDQGHRVWLVT